MAVINNDCIELYNLAIIIDDFADVYAMPATVRNDCIELYNLAIIIDDFADVYAMPAPVRNDCIEPYKHSFTVSNDVAEPYSLLERNPIISDSAERYVIVGQDTEILNNSASVTVAGKSVDFKSFSVSCEEGSYCFSFTGEPSSLADYELCTEEAELIATINEESFYFLIDAPASSREALTRRYSVTARSKTKLLDFPYCEPVTLTNETTTAETFIAEKAALQDITATLETVNWSLPANVLSMDGESILSGIKKLADAIGGVIQSTKAGALVVRYGYPVSPTLYDTVTPAMAISDVDDLLILAESTEGRKGYDSIIVSNQEIIDAPEKYIIIELDDSRNGGKTTFSKTDRAIYLRVYSDQAYDLAVTGGAARKIITSETREISEPETLAFVHLADASTAKPVHSVTSVTWYGANLGTLSLVPNSYNKLRASGSLITTIGVAVVSYKTVYDVWQITPPTYSGDKFAIMAVTAQDEAI